MYVAEDVGIVFVPAQTLGNFSPQLSIVDVVEFGIVGVELHHGRAATKGAAYFAHNALVVVGHGGRRTIVGDHDAVGHDVVDGAERGVYHIAVVHQVVAVGDPLLSLVALVANDVPVVALAPGGIGVLKPERRSPRAGCGVDEDVVLHVFAQFLFDADNSLAVFQSAVGGVGARGIGNAAQAVELEAVEVVVGEH